MVPGPDLVGFDAHRFTVLVEGPQALAVVMLRDFDSFVDRGDRSQNLVRAGGVLRDQDSDSQINVAPQSSVGGMVRLKIAPPPTSMIDADGSGRLAA